MAKRRTVEESLLELEAARIAALIAVNQVMTNMLDNGLIGINNRIQQLRKERGTE